MTDSRVEMVTCMSRRVCPGIDEQEKTDLRTQKTFLLRRRRALGMKL